MMRRLKIVLLFGLVLILAAATSEAALQPTRARRQQLDHFWCYRVQNPETVGVEVLLQDQFDIASGVFQKVRVLLPELFCNPVAKRHNDRVTPVRDENAHLVFYPFETGSDVPSPGRLVVYSNQFQRKGAAILGPATRLAVPTQKVQPGDHEFPKKLDHFKCYERAEAKPADAEVELRDQFQRGRGRFGVLRYFCNPTRKIKTDPSGNVEVTGVKNARDHLACYETREPGPAETFTAVVHNQFGDADLVVTNPHLLCVPTLKHHLGEIDSFTDIAPGRG